MKNVAVLTEDGAIALFFRPHPRGFDSSRFPTPGNLPSKAKKILMPGEGGGGGQEPITLFRNINLAANIPLLLTSCSIKNC